MALISCPECKGRVSDAAEACPHCGHPINSIRKTFLPTQEEVRGTNNPRMPAMPTMSGPRALPAQAQQQGNNFTPQGGLILIDEGADGKPRFVPPSQDMLPPQLRELPPGVAPGAPVSGHISGQSIACRAGQSSGIQPPITEAGLEALEKEDLSKATGRQYTTATEKQHMNSRMPAGGIPKRSESPDTTPKE